MAVALLMIAYAIVNHAWARYEWINTHTPEWAVNNTWRYYIRFLAESYPVIFPTLGVAAGLALARNTKASFFLLSCLAAPLLVQSFLLTWRHERYIVHLVPLMFSLFAVGVSVTVPSIHRILCDWARAVLRPDVARLASGAFLTVSITFFLAFMPWARDGLLVHQAVTGVTAGVYHHSWRSAARYVDARMDDGDVVIASAPGLAYYYGLRSRLYYLANDSTVMHLEDGLRDAEGRPLDYIAGAPMILELSTLQELMATHRSGWIVAERFRFEGSRPLPPEFRDFIQRHCRKEQVPDAPTMVVWRWPRPRA
jgi:hypothetical protein